MADSAHSTRRAFLKSAAAITALSGAGCAQVALAETETQEAKVRRLIADLQTEMRRMPIIGSGKGALHEIRYDEQTYLRMAPCDYATPTVMFVGFVPAAEA